MTNSFRRHLLTVILCSVAVIFVVLPFTTPISLFLGTKLNHLDLFKIWKEVAMVVITALILWSGVLKGFLGGQIGLRKVLLWAILAYAGLTIALGAYSLVIRQSVGWEAFIYALIVNLRFLFFFLLCWTISRYSGFLTRNWKKLLLLPAAVVIGFGLLQLFVLPDDFLRHIGYGPDTIAAYQTVDQKPDYVRIQSTLRGPNPLGVYLILIITALLVGMRWQKWRQVSLLVGALIVMFYSYSRSAWLGLAASIGILIYLTVGRARLRRLVIVAGTVLLVLLAATVYMARDNNFVQNTLLHTDETSRSPMSSNEGRAAAIQRGLSDVAREPFGRGPGSAGPASLRNDKPERIAENYYLQIGQELGWIGLSLFLAANVLTVLILWERRDSPLAKLLLASFVGISLANMVSHAWTDETISLLWWGLAGVAIAQVLPVRKHKTNDKTTKQFTDR
jgi:hypothetical protein